MILQLYSQKSMWAYLGSRPRVSQDQSLGGRWAAILFEPPGKNLLPGSFRLPAESCALQL